MTSGMLIPATSKSLNLPKFDHGNFECILDTSKDFVALLNYLSEKESCKKYVLIDAALKENYSILINKLTDLGESQFIYISSAESFKTFQKAEEIMNQILLTYPTKDDIIINIGGGVVLNLGGFIAGLLLRGINFIHVPTTLSSQTDVCLGGKQAVNLLGFKNQIGLFRDPVLCYINTNFLSTITHNAFRHQLVEGIKLCLTLNKDLFWDIYNQIDSMSRMTQVELLNLVEQFILLKAPLITEDPFERKIGVCNLYGHTLGHALEMASEGEISHCEAVGLGMLLAAKIAFKLKIADEQTVQIHKGLLLKLGMRTAIPGNIDPTNIFEHFRHDKKLCQGKIPFILLKQIGEVAKKGADYYHFVPEQLIIETINENY